MSGRTILNVESPKTQTFEVVKVLLAWRGRASDGIGNGEGRCALVLSKKKDAYYVVTARECSCPAKTWHPGQRCKHQRAHFPEQPTARLTPAGGASQKAEA